MHVNRDLYIQERDRYANLITSLLEQMKKLDSNLEDITVKDCIYRFNKDIRFSKDKSPYKTHFGAFLSAGGRKSPMPGYYLHIQPHNESGISGGSRCPSPAQRAAIILHIWKHRNQWQEIVEHPTFKAYFGKLVDKQEEISLERRLKSHKTRQLLEQLGKTKAKQVLSNTDALEILLYPRFCFRHPVNDEEVVKLGFEENVMKGFRLLKPFDDFLGEAIEV